LKSTNTGRKPKDRITAQAIRKIEELIKELDIRLKKGGL
tara:strand:+ start:1540 stop:1656 length:117 start_codon:yes stop_codon:yes gene_type:complete